MEVNILPVNADNLDDCARVIRESFLTVAKDFGLTVENCPTNGAFIKTERLISDMEKGNRMFALYEDGIMRGFMQLEDKGDGSVILEKLAVVPSARHRGCGKTLLDFAENTAREIGGKKLLAAIIEENTILKAWYLSNGFKHTGTREFPHLPFTVGFIEKLIQRGVDMDMESDIKIIKRAASADEFLEMRQSAGWICPERTAVEGGLKNTLFSVCAEKDGKLIGYGRLIGDGGIMLYIQDIIIKPEFQGMGVGTAVMKEIMEHISKTYGEGPTICLMAAKGKEGFYKRLGFIERPNERFGAGMAYKR